MINSNRLRELRMRAGLSQRQLCKLAGIGPLGIKRIEDGADASRLPLQVVARIAAALGAQITDLLSDPNCEPVPAVRAPALDPAAAVALDLNKARLLRRIHRCEDVMRSMNKVDRELTLPSLMRTLLVRHTKDGRLEVASEVLSSMQLAGI